jgi:hypothetical protein
MKFIGVGQLKLKQSLICAYYFHQLLPAIVALIYERKINNLAIDAPVLIYAPSLCAEEKNIITAAFPYCTFLRSKNFFIKIAFQKFMPIKIGEKILKKYFEVNSFDSIYFPHDVTSDFTAQVFMQAFPMAKRISYGDAFGNFIDRAYFETWIGENKKNLQDFFAGLKRKIKPLGCRWLTAQAAILMIPIDFSKSRLSALPLQIPPRKTARNVVSCLQKNNILFNNYINFICAQLQNGPYLFLLSNLAKSNLASDKNEYFLYQEIIEKHVPKEKNLILKPHAGGDFLQAKRLERWAIEKGYRVKIFDRKFLSMPIELAEALVKKCHVLSISYASISLQYFYEISVMHVLEDDLIDKYFFDHQKIWAKRHNEIYTLVQERLKTWDGKSVLY